MKILKGVTCRLAFATKNSWPCLSHHYSVLTPQQGRHLEWLCCSLRVSPAVESFSSHSDNTCNMTTSSVKATVVDLQTTRGAVASSNSSHILCELVSYDWYGQSNHQYSEGGTDGSYHVWEYIRQIYLLQSVRLLLAPIARPRRVVGATSPYPTVVMVISAHQ